MASAMSSSLPGERLNASEEGSVEGKGRDEYRDPDGEEMDPSTSRGVHPLSGDSRSKQQMRVRREEEVQGGGGVSVLAEWVNPSDGSPTEDDEQGWIARTLICFWSGGTPNRLSTWLMS